MTLLATLGYAAQGAAAMAVGAWSDRWTRSGRSEASIRRALLAAGQLVSAAAIVAIPFVTTVPAIGFLLCVAGIAIGCIPTNIYAVAQMFAGARASGTWVGIQNGIGNVPSGIVGPIIFGMIIDGSGYDPAFYLAGAVGAAGALWWMFVLPQIQPIAVESGAR
jgi:MFS family permease